LALAAGLAPAPSRAVPVSVTPPLGAAIPPDLVFRDEAGRTLRLADLLGATPVILAPVYYTCPNICGVTLATLFAGLADTSLAPGADYRVVAVSIEPAEGPADAAQAKAKALERFQIADDAVRFLTGDAGPLMQAIGFRYGRSARADELEHAVGAAVLTADGRLSRWLPGLGFQPEDLRLALVEAGRGRIGNLADRLLLLCSHFDPETGRYTSSVMALARGLGGATVLLVAGAIGGAVLLERRRGGRA
jgi:protein SCO1/2